MLESAIHPITYRDEGILDTFVKWNLDFFACSGDSYVSEDDVSGI